MYDVLYVCYVLLCNVLIVIGCNRSLKIEMLYVLDQLVTPLHWLLTVTMMIETIYGLLLYYYLSYYLTTLLYNSTSTGTSTM